ncbi:MAG TPA: DNA sulfur modification protein DndB [Bacteroidia bacterium]|jgi:hypothetical protein|nr:DNA sulfur modification protein DndB [Bacteroidia bacterium]
MNTKTLSIEPISFGEAKTNQSTSGKPLITFNGVNCGSETFTIKMSFFELIQFTEVANERSTNSEVAQRPLDIKHATAIAKYMVKGLLHAVYLKRQKQNIPTEGKLDDIIKDMGQQPYFALAPIVTSFRNCSPNGTNLKVIPQITFNDETIAYKIFLSNGDVLWVVDGQHRRKAAELVLDFLKDICTTHKYSKGSLYPTKYKEQISSEELSVWSECLEASKQCTLTIDIHLGLGIEQERQLFHDLNNLVKRVEKSLALKFDASNPVNQYIKEVLIDDKFDAIGFDVNEKDQSEWTKNGLSRKELVAINALLFLNKTNISGALPTVVEPRLPIADKYWDSVLNITDITISDAKLKTVAAQPVVLKAIAKLYFDFFFGKNDLFTMPENQEKLMQGISTLDFSHTNPMWGYYTLTDDQKESDDFKGLKEYLPEDDGKNRDLGNYDSTKTFRFGAKHNDIFPIIGDMIRWKLGLPSRKK